MTAANFDLARFEKDISSHKLTVVKDDGVHRHLWFGRPGSSCMHFQLVTWPGYLCYTGDMGTYVFTRLADMFEFFRRGEGDRKYRIDYRYWAEKVEAADKHDGITEFSEAEFEREVKRYLKDWIRGHADRTTREERRELWDAVMDEVLDAAADYRGDRKQVALHDFHHRVNAEVQFYFQDWESSTDEYTHRFLWCCHALAWAIKVYDDSKTPAPVAEGAHA